LTLKKCRDICRANETTTEQLKKISNEDVQYVRKKTQKPTKQHSKFNTNYSNEWKFCGKKHKPNKELCLAYDKTCSNCGIKNHFAFKCRKINVRKSRKVHQIDETSGSEEEEYVLTVQTNDSREEIKAIDKEIFPKKIVATMRIDRNEMKFQLDCGSTVNVLPEYMFRQCVCEKEHVEREKSSQTLVLFNGTETKPLGKKRLTLKNPKNNKKYNIEFVIVNADVKPILGARAIQHMKLVTVNQENILNLNQIQSAKSA
jgi:hypothetical protein